MEQTWLPGKIRERIRDLMKERGLTQAELALRIGTTESTLSRFLSGKTDKLGDESIIRIARAFDVSTDFLLGETDVPDRVNYDISELGLSVQAARNLYTKKVDARVVNRLLESPKFAETTYQIASFLSDELASGFAAQNQIYASAAALLKGSPEAAADAERLKTPIHQVELQNIEDSFMRALREIKREVGSDVAASKELTAQAVKRIYAELTRGLSKPLRKISPEQLSQAVARSVSHLPGVDEESVKRLFLSMIGGTKSNEEPAEQ